LSDLELEERGTLEMRNRKPREGLAAYKGILLRTKAKRSSIKNTI
jgi:hypothetical protein